MNQAIGWGIVILIVLGAISSCDVHQATAGAPDARKEMIGAEIYRWDGGRNPVRSGAGISGLSPDRAI